MEVLSKSLDDLSLIIRSIQTKIPKEQLVTSRYDAEQSMAQRTKKETSQSTSKETQSITPKVNDNKVRPPKHKPKSAVKDTPPSPSSPKTEEKEPKSKWNKWKNKETNA